MRAAVAAGELSQERLQSFEKLQREQAYHARQAGRGWMRCGHLGCTWRMLFEH